MKSAEINLDSYCTLHIWRRSIRAPQSRCLCRLLGPYFADYLDQELYDMMHTNLLRNEKKREKDLYSLTFSKSV